MTNEPRKRRIMVVGATSGDTGSAAIEACAGRERVDIVILHPHGRTSLVQRRQMTTVLAPNVRNLAVEGTFDDCQAILKDAFQDQALRQAVDLAAVNSINFARIAAQASAGVSTTLYRTLPTMVAPLALRHVVSPTVNIAYAPTFPGLAYRDSNGFLRPRFKPFGDIGIFSGQKSLLASFALDQRVQYLEQPLHVVAMKTGGGLVQDVQGAPGVAFGELQRELDTLRLTA